MTNVSSTVWLMAVPLAKTGIVAGHNHNNYFVAQNIGVISKRKERFYGSLIEKLQPCWGGAEMAVNSFE